MCEVQLPFGYTRLLYQHLVKRFRSHQDTKHFQLLKCLVRKFESSHALARWARIPWRHNSIYVRDVQHS